MSIKESIDKYKKYKKRNFPTLNERAYIRRFERTFAKMNCFDRDFFYKVYLREEEKDWWKKYYTRYTFNRMKSNVSRKFIMLFERYET